MTARKGPKNGPQNSPAAPCPVKKMVVYHECGTQAASAPVMNSPSAMSRQIAAQSMTKQWLIAVKPSAEVSRDQDEPLSFTRPPISA